MNYFFIINSKSEAVTIPLKQNGKTKFLYFHSNIIDKILIFTCYLQKLKKLLLLLLYNKYIYEYKNEKKNNKKHLN